MLFIFRNGIAQVTSSNKSEKFYTTKNKRQNAKSLKESMFELIQTAPLKSMTLIASSMKIERTTAMWKIMGRKIMRSIEATTFVLQKNPLKFHLLQNSLTFCIKSSLIVLLFKISFTLSAISSLKRSLFVKISAPRAICPKITSKITRA